MKSLSLSLSLGKKHLCLLNKSRSFLTMISKSLDLPLVALSMGVGAAVCAGATVIENAINFSVYPNSSVSTAALLGIVPGTAILALKAADHLLSWSPGGKRKRARRMKQKRTDYSVGKALEDFTI